MHRDFQGQQDHLVLLVSLVVGGRLDTTAFQGRLERKEKWYVRTHHSSVNNNSILYDYYCMSNLIGHYWAICNSYITGARDVRHLLPPSSWIFPHISLPVVQLLLKFLTEFLHAHHTPTIATIIVQLHVYQCQQFWLQYCCPDNCVRQQVAEILIFSTTN